MGNGNSRSGYEVAQAPREQPVQKVISPEEQKRIADSRALEKLKFARIDKLRETARDRLKCREHCETYLITNISREIEEVIRQKHWIMDDIDIRVGEETMQTDIEHICMSLNRSELFYKENIYADGELHREDDKSVKVHVYLYKDDKPFDFTEKYGELFIVNYVNSNIGYAVNRYTMSKVQGAKTQTIDRIAELEQRIATLEAEKWRV